MDDFTKNSIVSMYEGQIRSGKPNGLGRLITYDNQDVKIGFWRSGHPYGKMIHYNDDVLEQGIWKTN